MFVQNMDHARAIAARLKKTVEIKNRARPITARLKIKINSVQNMNQAGSAVKKMKKNKPLVENEPGSAHGHAVKKNKPRSEQEPRSAHGPTGRSLTALGLLLRTYELRHISRKSMITQEIESSENF